jgi:hypothetical protein
MRDPLDLKFSNIFSSIKASKEIEEHGNQLLSINEVRARLQYYNTHICSLSYSSNLKGLHCCGQYDHFNGIGPFFFVQDENNSDFEIYVQERQQEIERLKSLIEKEQTYFGKLKGFLEARAGQLRFDELVVESTEWEMFIMNGGGPHPENLSGNHIEIKLRPQTLDEVKSYNQYLYNYVQQLIRDPQKFHWLIEVKYEGFRAILAMETMRQQVKRALDKNAAIKTELNRIEFQFQFNRLPNYIEPLYTYRIDNITLWQSALFNAFVNGHEFDYGRKQLTVDEMKALVHVEQVFTYYKYVHQLTEDVSGTFDEMFEEAVKNGIMGGFKSEQDYAIEMHRYSFLFNVWLQENKDWEYGNETAYKFLLTQKVFENFLKDYRAKESTKTFLRKLTSEEAFHTFLNSYEKLQEQFRVKRKATKEDCEEIPNLKEGDIITFDPGYKTSIEAFSLLKNYYSLAYHELEKKFFIDKYKVWNADTIKAEIKEIEKFIDKANHENLSDACKAFDKWVISKDEDVYLRLKSGFYENLELRRYPSISSIGNKEASIYGRYFLFYEFLKEQLNALSPHQTEKKIDQDTFGDLKTIFDQITQDDAASDESWERGFKPLHDYIKKNVHEDVRADLETLHVTETNLLNWKVLLEHDENFFHERWKQKTEKIISHINGALEVIRLRIKRKEQTFPIQQTQAKTGKEVSSQMELAVSFSEPQRTEYFNSILMTITDKTVKENILLTKLRIDKAAFPIAGFTRGEIEHYQTLFARDFYFILHARDYVVHIEDKIRELLFYCKGIEKDLSTKQYEFLEDREQDKADCIEAERYKIYLESLLLHFSSPQQPTRLNVEQSVNEVSRTKQVIIDALESIDKVNGWKYAFNNENDYNIFLDLLTNYFEYKPYSIPQKTISLKRDCKTRLAKAFSPIHKELSNENKKLKSDLDFFQLIRVLSHFKSSTDAEIYQAITR